MLKALVAAGGEDFVVEDVADVFPVAGGDAGTDGFEVGAELCEALGGDAGGCFTGGDGFERFADLEDFAGEGGGGGDETGSAVRDVFDEAFFGEFAERFAHGSAADGEVVGKMLFTEISARFVLALEDGVEEPVVNAIGEDRFGHRDCIQYF